MLEKDPVMRVTLSELKKEPLFKEIDWDLIEQNYSHHIR
jgi:hypothetical protein